MQVALRNRLIGFGFNAWAFSVRLKRLLLNLGRPRIGALDHITIPVKDLDRARRFYCDVLGAAYLMTVDEATLRRFGRPPAENDGEGAYHISVFLGGTTRLDLFKQSFGQPMQTQGHPHFAFHVSPTDLGKWRRRLIAQGVPVDGPLQLGPPGQASLYFDDPFGNHLELTCLGYPSPLPIRPPEMHKLAWRPELPA